MGTPLTGASNAGAIGNIAMLDEYLAIGSMTSGVRTTTSLHRPPRISESLFITTTMDNHDEENRIYLYATVNLLKIF